MKKILLLAALAATPAHAEGEIVATDNPGSVALALQIEGYRAKLSEDNKGRPVIETGTGGTSFDIIFYGCKRGKNCTLMLFSAGFDLDNGLAPDQPAYWNSDRLIGRAFLDDDCDPYLDHPVVTDPLMSNAAFVRLIDDWDYALGDFREFIGFDEDETQATLGIATCGGASEPT